MDLVRQSDALAMLRARSQVFGGLYLGETERGLACSPPEHALLVLGPPRAGKTSALAVPNVAIAPGAVLAASTKPDLMDLTLPSRRRLGRCLLYDPSATIARSGVQAVGWSPLCSASNWDRAVLTAEAMVGAARGGDPRGDGAHWNERAGALLACCFHAGALEGWGLRDLASTVNRHDGSGVLEALVRHEALLALDLLVGIVETDAREQSGIWSTASGILAAARTEGALAASEATPLDPESFVAGSDTLYVCAPGDTQAHVAPLIAGMLRDIRSAAYARARAPGAETPRVLFVLDELANIAPLHDLPNLVAEGASQGVVVIACLQDLAQARARWGTIADGFLSLFGTKVVLPGIGDSRTLQAISLLAGAREAPATAVAAGRSSRALRRPRSRTVSSRTVPRLAPSAAAAPRAGEAIALIGAKVLRVRLTPAHASESWRELLPSASGGLGHEGVPDALGEQRSAPERGAQSGR